VLSLSVPAVLVLSLPVPAVLTPKAIRLRQQCLSNRQRSAVHMLRKLRVRKPAVGQCLHKMVRGIQQGHKRACIKGTTNKKLFQQNSPIQFPSCIYRSNTRNTGIRYFYCLISFLRRTQATDSAELSGWGGDGSMSPLILKLDTR